VKGSMYYRMVKIVLEMIVLSFSLLCSVRNTVIPQSYVIGGAETGDISQDNISRDRFFCNTMLKLRGWFQTIYFDQEKRYLFLSKMSKV
jgi:hypothetical protein